MFIDYAAESARQRAMAEEIRTLSAWTTGRPRLCDAYKRLAEDYDLLAAIEDQAALALKRVN
jgi:hypothetical protein